MAASLLIQKLRGQMKIASKSKVLGTMINAIDQLVGLYDNPDAFVKSFVQATLFLPEDVVQDRNKELIALYESGGEFPVRHAPAHRGVWKVRNKDEAIAFTRKNEARLPGYP